MEIAKFVVPPALCREVCANPAQNRGVFISYVGVEAVTLDFNGMPSEHRRVMIHRQFNAPRLLAKIGAIVMTKQTRPFELRDITEPHYKAAHLCGFDGWLALVGGVAASSGDPVVTPPTSASIRNISPSSARSRAHRTIRHSSFTHNISYLGRLT